MLSIETNWTREKPIDTDEIKNFPDLCLDYKEKLTKFPREFEGETFKAKAICAVERDISWIKNDRKNYATVLDVTFLIRDPRDSQIYYFTGGIFSPKERQSNKLHDFLMLSYAQKANVFEDTFTRKNFDKIETIYPHIAGCLFTLNIATSGYKDGFENFNFECYAQDGRSQEEIENNQTEAIQINQDLERLKHVFANRHNQKNNKKQAVNITQKANQYGSGTQQQAFAQSAQNSMTSVSAPAQQQKINSFTGMPEKPAAIDDDLPF